MTYLLNFLSIFVYYFIISKAFKRNPNKRNKVFAIIVGLHAILFRALADPYSFTDTGNYQEAYESISKMSLGEAVFELNFYTHMGQGYLFWNWILSRFTEDYHFLYIATAIVGVGTIVWFYYRSVGNVFFPMIIYLTYPMMYYQACGVLRQHFSVAFILLAIYYMNHYKKSIPLAITAGLMHTSGIVFLPFFFWNKISFKKFNILRFVPLLLLSLILFRQMMGYVLSFMPKYEEIVGSDSKGGNMLPVLWMGSIVIISFVKKIPNGHLNPLQERLFSFLYYGFLISLFCIGLNGMGRFTICFYYIIPVVSMIMWKYNKSTKVPLIVINVVVVLYHLYFNLASQNYSYSFLVEL